jgi:imidazolonepropionase-like amidohydrolase
MLERSIGEALVRRLARLRAAEIPELLAHMKIGHASAGAAISSAVAITATRKRCKRMGNSGDDRARRRVETGGPFSAVMCPSACMRSGAAAPPLVAMQAAGVQLAVGSDNVANNKLRSVRRAVHAGQAGGLQPGPSQAPSAEEALRMATLGGARASAGGEIGA